MLDAFSLNYIGPMSDRPRYHADDGSRDVLTFDPRTVAVENGRLRVQPHSLDQEGFTLVPHQSAVADFRDPHALANVYRLEMQQLILGLTGADEVVFSALPVCRSTRGARLTVARQFYGSRPGEFVHVDISAATAVSLAKRCEPKHRNEPLRRFAHYNMWRAFSPPPQDVPLAVCDSRSVSPSDLVEADAVMDIPGKREFSYVGLVIRYNPRHRWSWFAHMNRDEILIFKAYDSDSRQPNQVPHTAFQDPTCPPGQTPRASIEMRAIAYWYER